MVGCSHQRERVLMNETDPKLTLARPEREHAVASGFYRARPASELGLRGLQARQIPIDQRVVRVLDHVPIGEPRDHRAYASAELQDLERPLAAVLPEGGT
jgi:hypothetical protein